MFYRVWMYVWVLLWYKIVLVNSSQSCSADTCMNASINQTTLRNGHRLDGHVIRTVSLVPGIDCFHHCFLDCQCISFNLKETGDECELNSEDAEEHPVNLVPNVEYSYMEIRLKPVEKCTSSQCLNMCCYTERCHNGGTCQELCSHRKRMYQCSCPSGFSGRNCEQAISSSSVTSSSTTSSSSVTSSSTTSSSSVTSSSATSSSSVTSSSATSSSIAPSPTTSSPISPSSSSIPVPAPDHCAHHTCGPKGTCVAVPDHGYYCRCSSGYYGKECRKQNPSWSSCSITTFRFNIATYYLIHETGSCKKNRAAAKQECAKIGGNLAKLNTQALYNAFLSVASGKKIRFFGLYNMGGTSFKWEDGSYLQVSDFNKWGKDEPKPDGDPCTELKDDGSWKSQHDCSHEHGYVCEC